MQITNALRKNIGTIIAALGFVLLCIITFGDLGELFGEQYWENVKNNLTAIGFVSIGLTLIQVSIKQGLAEQALQRGLNTPRTTEKYDEHRKLIKDNTEKMIYLPYFLQIYNKRHTKLRKREFLVNNGFSTEQSLMTSGKKKLIHKYRIILTNVTAPSIKWSTITIQYDRYGRIITLDEYRRKRIAKAVVKSFIMMIGLTFLTWGLFFSPSDEPLWQKFVKLFTYIVSITIASIFVVVKEYEKGAFGVPNELDEVNQIWHEFQDWVVPDWIVEEVKRINEECARQEDKTNANTNNSVTVNSDDSTRHNVTNNVVQGQIEEVTNGQEGETTDVSRTDIQGKQEEVKDLSHLGADSIVSVPGVDDSVLLSGDKT